MKGTIKKLVADKGFGFIAVQSGEEYFFHRTSIAKGGPRFEDLEIGQTVEFQTEDSAKGPRAGQVR